VGEEKPASPSLPATAIDRAVDGDHAAPSEWNTSQVQAQLKAVNGRLDGLEQLVRGSASGQMEMREMLAKLMDSMLQCNTVATPQALAAQGILKRDNTMQALAAQGMLKRHSTIRRLSAAEVALYPDAANLTTERVKSGNSFTKKKESHRRLVKASMVT